MNPERDEKTIQDGYAGIEMTMDYLDDIVIKMIIAGADYAKLITHLAKEYNSIRNRILDKAIEEGQEVYPPEPEITEDTVTIEMGDTVSVKTTDPEEEGALI